MAKETLLQAKQAKADEFYTQLPDIENELRHYKEHFKDKVVLCNCDDPRVSNFFQYFANNFEHLGLKKLITTCYKSQERDLFSANDSERAIWLEYTGDRNGNRVPDPDEIGIHYFQGDGDFRSKECIELLKQADIVVTNPPFSLFREYVAQLIEYGKKFIILGNMNALTYKETFHHILNGELWVGYGFNISLVYKSPYENKLDANRKFVRSKGYDPDDNYIKVPAISWYTNLEHQKRHEFLELYKEYTSEEYPKYFNYNAIDIGKVDLIPIDYEGIMGVPITFLGKYNPEQFEIIGLGIATSGLECGVKPYLPEHKKYRKEVQHRGAVDGDLYMMNGEEVVVPYARILIRRKK